MADIEELLLHTSRTFALAIPLLPEPARTDVTLAYLVFRIADTLEDAEHLPVEQKIAALEEFNGTLRDPSPRSIEAFAERWSRKKLIDDPWHQALIAEAPQVFSALASREPNIAREVRRHASLTAHGMQYFLRESPNHLSSLADLRRYCYFVAGVVGEMLTSIFAERNEGLSITPTVRSEARAFGEGLQLVNILKDDLADARRGRSFIPAGVDRGTLYRLVRRDLLSGQFYMERLHRVGASSGYLAFTQLPLQLAWATLERIEQHGAGAKVSRSQLSRILSEVQLSLHDGPVEVREQRPPELGVATP